MNRKIKLIWDFKGETGFLTAKHHAVHLKEFAEMENVSYLEINYSAINEFHAIAFVAVEEDVMLFIRDRLKPHRATLYE